MLDPLSLADCKGITCSGLNLIQVQVTMWTCGRAQSIWGLVLANKANRLPVCNLCR